MPVFIADDDLAAHSSDASYVAAKADDFIRSLQAELDSVRAAADAAAITAEQTCSLLEHKFLALSADSSKLQSENAQLQSSLDERLSELAQLQAQKHQLHLHSIGKDGEIERLTMELSELQKSKRQLLELLEQKDLEISEKNATITGYLDKIVNLTDRAAQREARSIEIEAELARSQGNCARLSQEKELIQRHNTWLNDELTSKVDELIELRRSHADLEEDMSAKLADTERQLNECSSSLKWNMERVKELETKLTSVQEELFSSKDTAAANEDRFTAEISTVNKLVELYKESSDEWSRKAGELEGVIKALETHLSQVENDYRERLEKEVSARKQLEKEAADLKDKLQSCEAEVESSRKANECNLLSIGSFSTERWADGSTEEGSMLVPRIPVGVSGTALAASLLRDGWSEARAAERRKQEEYVKQVEREWAEAKKELQQERDNFRHLSIDRDQALKNAMRQAEEMAKELANALHAVSAAETGAGVAEAKLSDLEKKIKALSINWIPFSFSE